MSRHDSIDTEVRAAVLAERERCGELAAEFVHRRLYENRFPACSYHSRDIKDLLLVEPALLSETQIEAARRDIIKNTAAAAKAREPHSRGVNLQVIKLRRS